MSYKKYCKTVKTTTGMGISRRNDDSQYSSTYSKYKNYLPLVYQGPQNRIERYAIYDGMEQDPNISYTLDTISEYVSQTEEDPFKIEYTSLSELPASHTLSIEKTLDNWININGWKKRMFNVVREILKYGDIVFIRDPETNILNKCNIYDVLGVVCDENKNPKQYIIRNVDLNVPLSIANTSQNDVATKNLMNTLNVNIPNSASNTSLQTSPNDPNTDMTVIPVDAKYVIHLTLNIDNIALFPFGLSTLESVYKTYIQKILLQDCVLLNRIKNATDKLVFSIPVGGMPRYKIKQYMEKCKNELSQRRMPSKDGNGVFNTIDVAYNSIPQTEDFWLPVGADGIKPTVERLQASGALGEINDLVYWENQLIRGLKVPSSWVQYGPQDGDRTVNTPTASTLVQEQRFFKYCKRIQTVIIDNLDKEFKAYLKKSGINVDEDSFRLTFYAPSNVTEMTEIEMMKTRLELCSSAMQNPYISKQYALKYFLNLTEEQFNENQRLLLLEMQNTLKDKDVELPTEDPNQIPGLRSVGIEDIPMDYMTNMTDQMNAGIDNLGGGDLGGGMDMGTDLGGGMDMGTGNGSQAVPTSTGSASGLAGALSSGNGE